MFTFIAASASAACLTISGGSAKAEKLIVKLPHGQQQLPFSQQLQAMAVKQTKQPSTSETSQTELTTATATPRVMVTLLIHPPLETRQPRSHFHSKSNFKIFIYTAFLV